tara:strand:+ start:361 stop:555 length:195 start_codon:yes stop_codon:yes gene_type:complete
MGQKQIIATPNYLKKTFTLRCYVEGKLYGKYRTVPLPDEEFVSCEYNTQNDWDNFLKSDDYYSV